MKTNKKAKAKKSEYTVAQKISFYNANPAKWQSKGEGMMRAGIISGYITPEQWFHSDVYKAQQAGKGKGGAKASGAFAPVHTGSQTGMQGSLTTSVLTNNPGMTAMQAGVQNPGAVPVHATSS